MVSQPHRLDGRGGIELVRRALCGPISWTALVIAILVAASGSAAAHSGDVFSALAIVAPTIDAAVSSGEWSDADCIAVTVTADDSSQQDLKVCVKNDAANLYMLVIITNADYSAPNEPCFDFINVLFDNDHDGTVDIGENRWGIRFDGLKVDVFNPTGIAHHSSLDTTDGGTDDLTAAISHSNPGSNTIGTYTAEFSAPMNSGDTAHDFSLAAGNTVGFAVQMADGDPSPSLPCAGPFGGFYWPATTPPGWADIFIEPVRVIVIPTFGEIAFTVIGSVTLLFILNRTRRRKGSTPPRT